MDAELNILHPEFTEFTNNIGQLSENWDQLDAEMQQNEVIGLFEKARSCGLSKEQFYDEIKNVFGVSEQTIIILWIDTYVLYGHIASDTDAGASSEPVAPKLQTAVEPVTPKLEDRLAVIKERARKALPKPQPKAKPAKTEISKKSVKAEKSPKPPKLKSFKPKSIKALIKSKTCNHFSEEDIQFLYKKIKKEWASLTKRQGITVLRELFRYESSMHSYETVLDKLCSKLKFLHKDLITGYLVISKSDILRMYLQENLFDEQVIKEIGNIRSQLGELFNERELVLELKHIDEKFTLKLLKKIREKLKLTVAGIKKLSVGEIYMIDPDSDKAKDYRGYMEDTFMYINPNDTIYADYADLRHSSTQVLFVGRGNRIFVIDHEAVCLQADLIARQKKEEEINS